jgi:predicted anti-sigma-YlaC factor YlaD
MTDAECGHIRVELGAYLLGALEPADRARVVRHLEACAACRDELVDLAPLPGLLARIPQDEVPADAPSPGRADAAVAEIARIRRRRRAGSAVIAACAIVLVAVFGISRAVQDAARPTATELVASSARTTVSGHATLMSTAAGTQVVVGVAGVHPGTRCRLIVISFGGRREIAATWRANYEGDATVVGASALAPRQIHRLIVASITGTALAEFVQAAPPRTGTAPAA